MAFCTKCSNATSYVPEEDKLYAVCNVCGNKDALDKSQSRLYYEVIDVSQVWQNYVNPEIIHDNIYPIVEKNGELYTVILDKNTMRKKYISHKTKKIFDSI